MAKILNAPIWLVLTTLRNLMCRRSIGERITGSDQNGGEAFPVAGDRAMPETAELREFALDEFDQRYAALRLQATSEVREAMIQSLRCYGQISPVVVWHAPDACVLIDGFKRVEAARQVPGLVTLAARSIDADAHTAKAAMYALNRFTRRVELLEEAWIVCALVREDHLTQREAGQLLGHDKSWISRRLALVEKLCGAAQQELSLGLLNPSLARQLARLPVGNQEELLRTIRRDDLSTAEVRQVVNLLVGCSTREEVEYTLLKPREALRVAAGCLALGYDPRLTPAGNRLARRLDMLLEGLARMENWLRHRGRAELSHRDGELLRGGFERLGRDGQTVAELSSQFAKEFPHENTDSGDDQ
jgi:ParB-like nuclease domain